MRISDWSSDVCSSDLRTTVAVEVTSVVRASPASFQVRWIERTAVDGAPGEVERWTAIVTLVLQPPRDAARLRQHPLRIYVDGLDWSRELGANPAGEKPCTDPSCRRFCPLHWPPA